MYIVACSVSGLTTVCASDCTVAQVDATPSPDSATDTTSADTENTDTGNADTNGDEVLATETGTDAPATCPTGKADCDGNPDNGCETQIYTDSKNCGGCGSVCSLPNAASICLGS